MAKIAKQLTELIGHTPLLELTNYEKALGLEAKIIAKLEYFNPLGSVKDRVAAAMIEQGIKDMGPQSKYGRLPKDAFHNTDPHCLLYLLQDSRHSLSLRRREWAWVIWLVLWLPYQWEAQVRFSGCG